MNNCGCNGNNGSNWKKDHFCNGNDESNTMFDRCGCENDNSNSMYGQCWGLKGYNVFCEGEPCVENVEAMAAKNTCYRIAVFTGEYVQMTLMSIPAGQDVGVEIHKDTDQLIRVERGMAMVRMKSCGQQEEVVQKACQGCVIFVPAGTLHNVINIGNTPLKLSSVYAPPHHPGDIMQKNKPNPGNR